MKGMSMIIQEDLNSLNDWFQINKLTVNVAKSNFIIFSEPHKDKPKNWKLTINQQKLEEVHTTKYLGVWLDKTLSWKDHILKITEKIALSNQGMYRVRDYLPKHLLRMLYFAIIHSHINYCIPVWGTAVKSHMKKLKIMQKKTL